MDTTGNQTSSNAQYAALWPRSPRQTKVKPLAQRLDTLEGKTIGWIWDYVFRGNEVFEQLEASLSAQYPGMKFIHYSEFGNTHGSDEHQVLASLPEKLRTLKVDAVISGMGC